MVNDHITEFGGMPVEPFEAGNPLKNPRGKMIRIAIDYDEGEEGVKWVDRFAELMDDPKAAEIEGIVVGPWEEVTTGTESSPIVEALVAARAKLPKLRAIFFGDVIGEESEISWINQSDVSPILEAYPRLEHFAVRGGQGLSLGSPHHAALRTLIVQAGGLPADVVRGLGRADLPMLEHLELWLGSDSYGGDATVEDLAPLLSGRPFPKLKYLGLKNSEIQDDVAAAVVTSPLLSRLDVLDLSMGTLGDEGAQALLDNVAALKKLKLLDIHYHYVSDELVEKLKNLGVDVDASDVQEAGAEKDDRYAAVTE